MDPKLLETESKYCLVYMPGDNYLIYGFPTDESAHNFMCRFVVCNTCKFNDWADEYHVYQETEDYDFINMCSGEWWVIEDDDEVKKWPEERIHFAEYFEKAIGWTKFKEKEN